MSETSAHISAKWMTDAALADIVKHPINSGASEAREMAEEILALRQIVRTGKWGEDGCCK